jgi:predicted nucleic-acid-binding protein
VAEDANALPVPDRFLVRDDVRQAARAASLIRNEEIWIAKTVLLETEWVLRSLYSFSPESVGEVLRSLASLETVLLEDEGGVAKALDWSKVGLDFADAPHLASAGSARRFGTFDRKLAKQANHLTGLKTLSI